MAYDPEARETSNSAMTIAIVVLVLVVGAAVAYFATRGNDAGPDVVAVPGSSTSTTTVVEKPVPAPSTGSVPGPPVVINNGSSGSSDAGGSGASGAGSSGSGSSGASGAGGGASGSGTP